MAIFGLVSKKEHGKLLEELQGLKAALPRYQQWMLQTADNEKHNLPDPSVYGNQADLYRTLSWVLLAVDITASAGALTRFDVKRVISGKEPKDIPNHPFEILLNHPNEMDSRYEFLYSTIAFFKLAGNAYWWLNSKDENTPPDEMWFIPPNMIQPVPDKRMYLKGYMYYPGNGMEIFLKPHEIVHFKRFNPFSRFVGLSAVEAIAMVARGDLGMQNYNTTLFAENNGRLASVMTFEQMVADPTWEKIKDDTREAARNREMLMLRGVGEGGVKWLQNAVTQREMEFLEGRKFNKEEILSVLAPGLHTMLSENSTQANSVVGRAVFNEQTVYPAHVMISEKVTNSILKRYSRLMLPEEMLLGEFEDIRVTDKDMKLREQEAFERTHTLAEVREEIYGDDPLGDERDKLLPSQIKSAMGGQEPQQDAVNNVQPDNKEAQPTQEEDVEDSAAKMREDLARYQRKAAKRIGQAVKFESDNIPAYVLARIEQELPACKSEDDIRTVFRNAGAINESRVALTADAIREALRFKA